MENEGRSLIYYPDSRLRQPAGPAPDESETLRRLSRQLFDLMYQHRGRGFAAVQAGISWRLFVINPTGDPRQPDQERVFINPQILSSKPRQLRDEEGCLSIPAVWADVERPKTIKVRYQDLDGRTVEATYDGTYARIFQHELDHLDGVLFIDRLDADDKEKVRPLLEALEKGTAPSTSVS